MAKFQIIEVPPEVHGELEQMGTKFKFWYKDPVHGYCLFKEGHANTGEDWAEKVAAELCELLNLPHAKYKLATWQGRKGVITPNFISGEEELVPGNQVLYNINSSYPRQERKTNQHSIGNIFSAFEESEVQMPTEDTLDDLRTAQQVFVGYLMLDALIGNSDRHHENWAIVRPAGDPEAAIRLAPTHDHAASMGCILRDEEREERLRTKDKNRTVEAYAVRGRSACYENEESPKPLPLIDAFHLASTHNPEASNLWIDKLESVTMEDIRAIFDRLPDNRITPLEKDFALSLIEVNRERILKLRH